MYEIDAFRLANNIQQNNMTHRSFVHDDTPYAELPRMPPNPFGKQQPISMRKRMNNLSMHHKVNPNQARDVVDEIKYGFLQQANNLLSTGTLPIPPGHPLYSRHLTLASLESERDMLLKENAELKQRLDDSKKGNESDTIATDL